MSNNESLELGKKKHSNVVMFHSCSIESINYITDSLVVSAEQPHDPKPIIERGVSDADIWSVKMVCGRHKTREVANDFISISGGTWRVFSPADKYRHRPDGLNFFFGLNFVMRAGFKRIPFTLFLGQGSNGIDNNWWIGVEDILSKRDGVARLVLRDSEMGKVIQIFGINGNANEFKFSRRRM